MPVSLPFFLFGQLPDAALRWIRIDRGPPPDDPRLIDSDRALRRAVERLPPHLRRDLLRDE